MKIAFYCPLKSPNHPVPSGDRLMARLLMAALERAGHQVEIASELRAFMPEALPSAVAALSASAEAERERLSTLWQDTGPPDAWFCYHPYYKAPDLIGPSLARDFGLGYVTAEASYSARRNTGLWAEMQANVLKAVKLASVNICLTRRDLDGLAAVAVDARLALLPPFIDPTLLLEKQPAPEAGRLITVAMMRSGDKMQSYVMLAHALSRLAHLPWQLAIVGDGPRADEVRALFAGFDEERIVWHGQKTAGEIADLLSKSALYVWPGCGEAYGLAYLEAQAAGLPVVAQAIAGVPEVVVDGRTGLLTPPGDIDAYAKAIERLLTQNEERQALAAAARIFAGEERSLDRAAGQLGAILEQHLKQRNKMDDFDRVITEELDRWQQAGKVARFWLRDDDAVEPSAPLERLLEITGAFSVPLTLAVIPAHTGDALAHRLEREPLCTVAVHGWSHVNYAGADEKKQELGRHRPASQVLEELQQGFQHLARLHPNRFVPILVPPWNRIDTGLVQSLAGLGFVALSVYGPEKPSALPVVNTHVDVMDWHGTRGGRDRMALAAEIVARLRQMFDHGGSLGLLTHHLVHDEAVWDFMNAFFDATTRHPACRWCRVTDILRDQ